MYVEWVPLQPDNIAMCAPLWGGAETYAPGELQRVIKAAGLLLTQQRGLGAVVLENGRPRAFGMTTFADEALIDAYLEDPHPHLGKRLLQDAHHPQSTSVLRLSQIAERNASGGLQIVVVSCGIDPAAHDPGTVYGAVIAAFFHVHRGYRVARCVNEVFGAWSVSMIEASHSYEIRRRFELAVGSSTMPSLVGTVSREQAAVWSNPVLALFAYSPPRLQLTGAERQLLSAALAGVPDHAVSARLGIATSAINARWTRVQERVARLAPELFAGVPATTRRGRGVQTRHLILQYVRDHPSELTPYAWPRRRRHQ
jgi:hypothetical protein